MQLFSRHADALARVAISCGVLLLFGVPLFLMWWVRTPYVTGQFAQLGQPIPFDHRHHVVDDGIDCLYCHRDVERSANAGVPPTELCLNCHNQIWNNSPAVDLLWSSRRANRPIAWTRVTFLPDFVFFNHAVHVHKGVACETCHGRIDEMARVYQVAPLTMSWCLDCHRAPEAHLRPVSAVTTMGYEPPRPQHEMGEMLMTRYHVRRLTNCTTCHR